jgi:asparagine synthase (glutamine-hydrolysing)
MRIITSTFTSTFAATAIPASATQPPPRAISLGTPRFTASALAQMARTEGTLAAWQAAFLKHGATAPGEVQGPFAVGLHLPDGRSFLAVDRFGIEPLCYRVQHGRLHFASRADALTDEPPELDPQAIFDYLYFHVIPSPRTIYKDVFRVPAGHCVVMEKGQLTVTPYWRPDFTPHPKPTFSFLKTEFHLLLQQAVARQLDDTPAACFLSGGTDSSTVAGMAAQLSAQTVATYSIGFDAAGYDEMAYARLAARHFNTRHREYYVTPDDLVRSIPTVAAYYDQPFGNSSALPAYYCARMAQADGVHKLLAGDGGDELFGGNTRYAKQAVFGWYGGLPAALRELLLEPLAQLPGLDHIPLVRKAASYINQARVPMPDRLMTYNLLTRLGVSEVLSDALLARIDPQDPARQQAQTWAQLPDTSLLNRMLAYDWRYTLADCDLPKVTGTCALAGVSAGFPMLDEALLAFSMKLPADYKLRHLKLRWFFKEALRGFLPDDILSKKKQGFGLPFGVWATRHPALYRLAADSLHALADRGLVRPAFIQTLLKQHLPSHPGYYGEMVWVLMMLEQWLAAKAPNYRL